MLSPPDKINLRFGDSHRGYSECVYERKSVLSVCALVMLCMSLLGASCEAIINTMVSLAMQTSGHRVPKETEMKIKKKKKGKQISIFYRLLLYLDWNSLQSSVHFKARL